MRVSRQRRGAMYVVVLMSALIVTVIGLSGVTVARLQLREAKQAHSVYAARFYAQSAVETGMQFIAADAAWRTTYTHDLWLADRPIDDGLFTWKIVDDENLDLETDPSAHVRIYGMGMLNGAVRVYSVQVQPEVLYNLLANPGIENGVSDWAGHDCTVATTSADVHSGAKSLVAKNRVDYWSGPFQNVTDKITIGETYYVEAWFNTSELPASARIVMWIGREWPWEGPGGQWLTGSNIAVNSGGWTLIKARLTPTWAGTLNAACVKVDTSFGSGDFLVDDLVFREAYADLNVVAGTWRREMAP